MNFNITIVGQTISFIIFVMFCMKFIWPPIITVIEQRQKNLKNALELEKKIKLDLKLAQDNALQKINNAKTIAYKIVSDANKNKQEILERAELEALKRKDLLISQAYSEIEIKRQIVYAELKEEISDLSLMVARKIIKHICKKEVDTNFDEEFINKFNFLKIKKKNV